MGHYQAAFRIESDAVGPAHAAVQLGEQAHFCNNAAGLERDAPDLLSTRDGDIQAGPRRIDDDAVRARDRVDQAGQLAGGLETVDATCRILEAGLPLIGEV